MSEAESPGPSPSGRGPLRRWTLALGGVLAGLALLYLLGANLFLRRPDTLSRLLPPSEKLRLEWRSAWSPWPGRVHLRGVEIRGQNRDVQWWARLEQVSLTVDLPALAGSTFHATEVEGEGLEFRLRRRLEEGGGAPTGPGGEIATPEIPGLDNPPQPPPEEVGSGPPPGERVDDRPPGWRIRLEDIGVGQVRELWIQTVRLEGPGHLTGELDFRIRGPLEVPRGGFQVPEGRIRVAGDEVLTGLRLEVSGSLDEVVPRDAGGREILGFLTARVRLDGRATSLGWIERFFHRVPDLELDGGGRISVDVATRDGRLEAGSRLEMADASLDLGFLDYRARGRGTVLGEVREEEPPTRLALHLDSFGLQRRGESEPYLRGEGLEVLGTAGGVELTARPPHLQLEIDLPESEIPDFSAYNRLLPKQEAFRFLGGRGRARTHLTLDTAAGTGRGEVELHGDDVRARWRSVDLVGDLSLHTRLSEIRLRQRHFDLADTELRIRRGRLASDETSPEDGWSMDARVTEGRLDLDRPPSVEARFGATLGDLRPLVEMLTADRPVLDWLDNLLQLGRTEVGGEVQGDPHRIALWGLDLDSGRLAVEGDLVLGEAGRRALFHLDYGPLSAAFALDDGDKEVEIFGSRKWFEERRRAWLGVEGR